MTPKARCVRARSGRDGLCDAVALRRMARRAARAKVFGVIESGAEAAQTREPLHSARLRVRVTDRADRARLIAKLGGVAAGARQVIDLARKADTWTVRVTPMAE